MYSFISFTTLKYCIHIKCIVFMVIDEEFIYSVVASVNRWIWTNVKCGSTLGIYNLLSKLFIGTLTGTPIFIVFLFFLFNSWSNDIRCQVLICFKPISKNPPPPKTKGYREIVKFIVMQKIICMHLTILSIKPTFFCVKSGNERI